MAHIQNEPTSLKPGRAGQMTGRPCQICVAPVKILQAIDELLIKGEKAKSVWRWAQQKFPEEMGGVRYDTFTRHSRQHVKPIARAVNKLSDHARLQRKKVDTAKAVLADDIDPTSYFGPAEIARDIRRTSDRLDDAADDAHRTRQHSALASLSGALVRTHELRAKMGGSIRPDVEINISMGLQELHGRLDGLIGAQSENRQSTARGLLGLLAPSDPLPGRRRPIQDLDQLSNPGGDSPLTIDAIPVSETPEPQPDPESRSASLPGGKATPSSAQESIPNEDEPGRTSNSWGEEPLGTRYR